MSRFYMMTLEVKKYEKSKEHGIIDAANNEWPFKLEPFGEGLLGTGEKNLCGGETEDEFARRVAKAVFKANGKPCEVDIRATFLEELPYEAYHFDEHNASLMNSE